MLLCLVQYRALLYYLYRTLPVRIQVPGTVPQHLQYNILYCSLFHLMKRKHLSHKNKTKQNNKESSKMTNSTRIADRVERVFIAKSNSKISYDQLAKKLGVTNTYTAQLIFGQAKLTAHTAKKLKVILPDITDDDL